MLNDLNDDLLIYSALCQPLRLRKLSAYTRAFGRRRFSPSSGKSCGNARRESRRQAAKHNWRLALTEGPRRMSQRSAGGLPRKGSLLFGSNLLLSFCRRRPLSTAGAFFETIIRPCVRIRHST